MMETWHQQEVLDSLSMMCEKLNRFGASLEDLSEALDGLRANQCRQHGNGWKDFQLDGKHDQRL